MNVIPTFNPERVNKSLAWYKRLNGNIDLNHFIILLAPVINKTPVSDTGVSTLQRN